MGLKLHERHIPVAKAHADFLGLLIQWRQEHPDITLTEEAKILNEILSDTIRYLLRYERHGTTSKKADEA